MSSDGPCKDNKYSYLMTTMLIMVKYFSYLTARLVSTAVMQVREILSHLSGGKESTFLTPKTHLSGCKESTFLIPRPVVKVTFLPSDS